MSRMPIEEMSRGGHEARVCGAREPVHYEKERKESAKRKRQTASEYDDGGRSHACDNAVRPAPARGRQDCKLLSLGTSSIALASRFDKCN